MKPSFALIVTLLLLLFPLSKTGLADGLPQILAALQDSRAKLLTLVESSDSSQQKSLIDALMASHKEIDGRVAALLSNSATPADVKARIESFKNVWDLFKETREKEIFPAIVAGDKAKAKGLGKGIQGERMQKMLETLK
ncbi:MAG: MCP four helix bundle domain-containing protein [Magnetococcus sp. YQC-9]